MTQTPDHIHVSISLPQQPALSPLHFWHRTLLPLYMLADLPLGHLFPTNMKEGDIVFVPSVKSQDTLILHALEEEGMAHITKGKTAEIKRTF